MIYLHIKHKYEMKLKGAAKHIKEKEKEKTSFLHIKANGHRALANSSRNPTLGNSSKLWNSTISKTFG